jgi:hypothetical protein
MKVNDCKRLFLALLCTLLTSSQAIFAQKLGEKASHSSKILKGEVNVFGVLTEDLQSDLGLTCTRDGTTGMKVAKVKLGTEAYYQGIQEGDKLLNARIDANQVFITINRDGHVYTAKLMHYGAGQSLTSATPKADLTPPPMPPTAVKTRPLTSSAQQTGAPTAYTLNTKKAQLLARYNLELIVDQSLSMRSTDCPGGLSRWDWCGVQSTAIAKAIEPYMANGVTFTPFNADFTVYEHVSSPQLISLFANPNFRSGTRLAEPLSARLDNFLSTYKPGMKPLLITVITDGLPVPAEEPEMVKQVLINATQKMIEPHEVTVVFLQIGGRDERGKHYLEDLDANLVSYGAKYPVVQTKSFDQLQAIGLGEALVDAIQDFNGLSDPPKTGKKITGAKPQTHKR